MSTGHQGTIRRAVDHLKNKGVDTRHFKHPTRVIVIEKQGYIRFEYEGIGETVEVEFDGPIGDTDIYLRNEIRVSVSPYSEPFMVTERSSNILQEDPEVRKAIVELVTFIFNLLNGTAERK